MDMIPLLPDFLDLLRFLNEERVEYHVVGGMAVNFYGYHRSTGDLDVWVALTPENENRLATALKRFGFSDGSLARRPLLEKSKFIRIGNQPVRVEIHADISGVDFRECFANSVTCDVQGVPVRFIGLNDLKQNKLAAGRAKDLADIEALPSKESDAT